MKSPFKFAAARPERHVGLGDLPATWRSMSTTWRSSIRCYTETNNHSPALFQINTGMSRMGFPVRRLVGDLRPGHARTRICRRFVVMYDTLGRGLPKGHAQNWGAGFLPGVYQGTALNAQGAPIDNLDARRGDDRRAAARAARSAAPSSTSDHLEPAATRPNSPRASRASNWPTACRWPRPRRSTSPASRSTSASSTASTKSRCAHFAKQCLMARRLVERGVRFVQIYSGGMENERRWDGHNDIEGNHRQFARRDRSADRRAAHRPQAARPARLDAGRLLRRVRPPADRAERRDAGPRSQPARLHRPGSPAAA